ncbi:hypothetical protein PMAYCL1PPCAC_25311, partial [Pristionchus mayeri]
LSQSSETDRMTGQEQAESCRSGLASSLRVVDELTSSPSSPAEVLLHRMNGVLRATAEANYVASGSFESIDALYESIDSMQQEMITHCEDLPFLYFSRSFAAVMEGLMRQLHHLQTTVPHALPYAEAHEIRRALEEDEWEESKMSDVTKPRPREEQPQRVPEEEESCGEEEAAAADAAEGESDSEVDSQDENNSSFFSVD